MTAARGGRRTATVDLDGWLARVAVDALFFPDRGYGWNTHSGARTPDPPQEPTPA
jgi:hypothetical protein